MVVKVYTCCHKPYFIPSSDIIEPMHVGAENANCVLDIKKDNTGDNISNKNPHFCELTATYWIWKNSVENIVGLFHYRRFLNFSNKESKVPTLTEGFFEKYNIRKEIIENILSNHDVILPMKFSTSEDSLYAFYEKYHVISDLDLVIDVIDKKYPEMSGVTEEVLKHNTQGYFANMIITRKAFFDEYATWLFDVLFEVERKIQKEVLTRDAYQQRVYGFLSERMMSVFIEYKRKTASLKIFEVPLLFIEDDPKKWRKHRFRMFKRKILTAIGLGKKKWKEQM